MKQAILILLISFGMKGQSDLKKFTTNYNEEAHFYGAVILQQVSYHSTNKTIFKERYKAFWFSWFTTQALIQGKEVYDCLKKKPTGYDWKDVVVGNLGLHSVIMVQIAANDINGRTDFIDEQYYENYGNKK